MTMIPGTWEPRRRTAVAEDTPAPPPATLAMTPAAGAPAPRAERRGLPTALQVSIFAATLLAAGWLVMAAF